MPQEIELKILQKQLERKQKYNIYPEERQRIVDNLRLL